MKDIRIVRLFLENFKCHKSLDLNFACRDASIYGDNASGKSSVYDALTWLLFGKDSHGKADTEIKPLGPDGLVADHEAVTAVEAALAINGTEVVTLRRTLREIWSAKRGKSTQEFAGNVSEYFLDGVPVKKNGFDGKVKELVGEDLFRVLTSVRYFSSEMKWQERRAILFDIAGNLTDEQIMMQDERFWRLKDAMGEKGLTDLKARLLADRKRLNGAKTDGPARMSECQKMIDSLSCQDFDTAKQDALRLDREASELRDALSALKAGSRGQEIRYALREKDAELRALESRNEVYRRRQDGRSQKAELEKNLAFARKRKQYLESQMENIRMSLDRTERSLEAYRAEWVKVNGESFAGGKCPTCGQSLPFEQLKAQTDAFDAKKKERLERIESMANHAMESCESYRKDMREQQDELSKAEQEIHAAQKALEASAKEKAVTDMPDYQDQKTVLEAEMIALEKERKAIEDDSLGKRMELSQRLEEVNAKLKDAQRQAAGEGSLRFAQARLQQLRKESQDAAEALEKVEGLLFLIEEFTRYKASFLESAVNAPFRLAKIRLFREQNNGGVEERCDVTVDGVPYGSLNSAMQINVGIDIIDALSTYYGVRVPLFVDNAESVTELENMDSQMIRLIVRKEDKELRIV